MAALDVVKLREEYKGPHELVETSDGKTLFVRRWNSKGEAPASVLILHGITAYSGPYGLIVADQLAGSGFDVFGVDLRGHGLSDGKRGDSPSKERLVDDLKETVALVRSKSTKLVIMGHSLGAFVGVVAVKSCPGQIDGVVLASIARKLRTGAYPKPTTGAMLRMLLGVTIMRGTPTIEYRRGGQIGRDDPLFTFRYSARSYPSLYGVGALEAARMMRSGAIDSPNLRFDGKLQIPLLVAVGDMDELVTADAAKEFFDSIDCDDKEFIVIPGGHHAAFPGGAWSPLAGWLQNRFGNR
jgi:alpha-beta hydrolase superfamily lysophospholipase